jgi:hypothetical protein
MKSDIGKWFIPKTVPVYLFYKSGDLKKYGTYVYYVQYITGEKRELTMDEDVVFADEERYALYDGMVFEAL